ncbi:MAG: dephospho-CoA kinase [Phycisphaerales bacterium]|nr:MAG: dephospho-CoA kinase [Phycisphaerales bacterium]
MIGIMGGIASGKSAVAAEFAKLGCKVIDADEIVYTLLNDDTVKERIVACFGRAILNSAGRIDHEKLAGKVFAEAEKLAALNEIIHPFVLKRAEELMERYSHQDQVKAIVLDMPLLVEVGWAGRCDRLIFVECRDELRACRAKKKGFDENQLKIRENFQISLDKKVALADNTVVNNSGFSALVRQVADIFSDITDIG